MEPQAPGLFVVLGQRKRKVHEVAAELPSARDERHGHRDRHLVVVLGPAAVEVVANLAFVLGEDALEQVVAVAERAREAAGAAEDVRPLPREVEGDDAAERRADETGVERPGQRAEVLVDARLDLADERLAVRLVARLRVLGEGPFSRRPRR
jgi:hypothetical protein